MLLFVLAGFMGLLFMPMLGMLYVWDEIARMPAEAWKLGCMYKLLSIVWCMASYAIEYGMARIIYKQVICKQIRF